jgi:hypothetical protein
MGMGCLALAPPYSAAELRSQAGGFLRRLFERKARVRRPAWRATQGTRSIAEGDGMGSPSLGYLSWRSKIR